MSWIRKRRSSASEQSTPAGSTTGSFTGPDLAADDPGLLEQMYVNAELLEQKAYLQHRNHDRNAALGTQARAVEAWERVVAGDPRNPMVGTMLGAAYNQYAVFLAVNQQPHEAVDQANKALRILGPLTDNDPRTILPIIHGTLDNIIVFLDDSGQHDDAALARLDRAMIESALAHLD
jgi:tetratricopeptide (TPR) repeat protein